MRCLGIVAAGCLTALAATPVQAFSSADCNAAFATANVAKTTPIRTNAGRVDFGDGPHLAGWPAGTAVICWSIDGRVFIDGYIFADSRTDEVMAMARIRVRRNGVWSADFVSSVFGNFAASKRVRIVTDTGAVVDRVRIRLFSGAVPPATGQGLLLSDKTYSR